MKFRTWAFWTLAFIFCVFAGREAAIMNHDYVEAKRMHAIALRHRAYEGPAQWKHDERAWVDRGVVAEREFSALLSGAIVLVLLAGKKTYDDLRYRPVMWSADTLEYTYAPPPPSPQTIPARQPTLKEKRELSGEIGQQVVRDALRPLEALGWTVLAEKVEFGERIGDVDFVLGSPHGFGYAIDAKHGRQRVTWDQEHLRLWFLDRWSGERRPYPAQRAWMLADKVRDDGRFWFSQKRVFPAMCFTGQLDTSRLRGTNGYGVYYLWPETIAQRLQDIDEENAGRYGTAKYVDATRTRASKPPEFDTAALPAVHIPQDEGESSSIGF